MSKKWMFLLAIVIIAVGSYFIKIGDDNVWVYLWKLVAGEKEEVAE